MVEIGRDIRIGIRGLRRSPGFALAAILSLALAIGLNTVIFSILNAVLLQSIPVPDPGRLLRIGRTVRGEGFQVVSNPEYRDIAVAASFEGVLAHQINSALLNIAAEPAEVPMELVSGNYFEVLDLDLARGRGFATEEDRMAGTHPVLVISWRLWRQRFAADPEVVGREVRVNGHRFEVVGVAPEGFVGTFPGFLSDIWVPLMMQAQALPRAGSLENRSDRFLNLIGCLAPGVTQQQATAELDALALRMAADHPVEPDDGGLATASAEGVQPMIASVAGPFLGFLMAVVGLVLLIAAANVTNMILARASNRRHETAVRIALGAGRARLFREHLIEALLLAVLGQPGASSLPSGDAIWWPSCGQPPACWSVSAWTFPSTFGFWASRSSWRSC